MILAPELKYDSILAALEKGDFYASTGPEITSLSILGTVVSLECSPAVRIRMVESPKRTAQVAAETLALDFAVVAPGGQALLGEGSVLAAAETVDAEYTASVTAGTYANAGGFSVAVTRLGGQS